MPFISINGADIYYEAFGADVSGRAPIVLIHGSTGTGHSNWGQVAPLLAQKYRVIVPDCRGHGQSSNPNHSYSFVELADDTAALVCALGYERAHIIGHSNGGNVALVTLLEHPEVIQTAVPQAANAWISPDLPEKEPAIFDPDRVAREDPAWMNSMLALHTPTHGPEYWRELLKLTVQEIITQPNYTVDDLKRVQRPTLVIQGENDRVNALYKHAQFIALNISDAELWIPECIGHNVHDEVLFAWVDKVFDFLERRGSDAGDALYRLGRQRYPDRRVTVFNLHAEAASAGDPRVILSGRVLTDEQRQACADAVSAAGTTVDLSAVDVLLCEEAPWALVKRGVNDLRRGPGIHTERVSQALLGEIVHVLDDRDGWAYVQMDQDGYIGWVQEGALHRCSQAEAQAYLPACNGLVQAEQAVLYSQAQPAASISGRLPFGAAVLTLESQAGYVLLELPGGMCQWTPASAILPMSERPQPGNAGIEKTLAFIQRFTGVPYLWGGRTPFGYDCSGLAQTFMRFMGVNVPRDADQQYAAGNPVEGTPQPGDLLFFGDALEEIPNMGIPEPGFSISHVGISLGGDLFIHSNGAAWSISYNSFDPESPVFRLWLRDNLVGVRRFVS